MGLVFPGRGRLISWALRRLRREDGSMMTRVEMEGHLRRLEASGALRLAVLPDGGVVVKGVST